MSGTLAILNVGVGDTKLTFDNDNPEERAKSAKIVKDMIRRGFVLLIEVGNDDKGPIYRRAHDFDETTAEYIVAGSGDQPEATADVQKVNRAPRKGGKIAKTRIPASATNAVAIARTAGG